MHYFCDKFGKNSNDLNDGWWQVRQTVNDYHSFFKCFSCRWCVFSDRDNGKVHSYHDLFSFANTDLRHCYEVFLPYVVDSDSIFWSSVFDDDDDCLDNVWTVEEVHYTTLYVNDCQVPNGKRVVHVLVFSSRCNVNIHFGCFLVFDFNDCSFVFSYENILF